MIQIIIIGGGIVGMLLTLAISSLNKNNIQILLIETYLPNSIYFDINNRAIGLTYHTCQQLKKIGIWYHFKQFITPITDVYISEYKHIGKIHINTIDYSLPALGYTFKLNEVKNFLFTELKKIPNVILYCPDQVIDIKRSIKKITVKLISGIYLTGELLIAANGNKSIINKTNYSKYYYKSYQQCAIVTDILTSIPPNGKAFEHFTQDGSLAILPISQKYSSVIWCQSITQSSSIMKYHNNEFIEKLQNVFGWKLGEILKVNKRQYFPLLHSEAEKKIEHRTILIGNAAQTIHPIAGQGLNLSIRDIIILTELIDQIINYGGDIGDYSVLMQYQTKRIKDRQNIIKLTNNLNKLFANKNPLISISRNIGLILIDLLPCLRDLLVIKTMGNWYYV